MEVFTAFLFHVKAQLEYARRCEPLSFQVLADDMESALDLAFDTVIDIAESKDPSHTWEIQQITKGEQIKYRIPGQ